MGNASKFTFTGHIGVAVTIQGRWLVTEIEDTGVGISASDLRTLF